MRLDTEELLTATGIVQRFDTRPGVLGRMAGHPTVSVRAVDDVELSIARGEIIGLVGESGSGKTTLARLLAGLRRPTEGHITFGGVDYATFSARDRRRLRRRVHVVFQDAQASLSPRRRIATLLTEPYKIHGTPPDERQTPAELLAVVGLGPDVARKYAHEVSGGQARRVVIARSLALRPELLIADEPTTGLDVSTAAGVLNLLRTLADRFALSMLIITHDLGVVGSLADRVAVMYLGQIVEIGPAATVLTQPSHPYTAALLSAVAIPRGSEHGRRIVLHGEPPNPADPPTGCRFHTRCPIAQQVCTENAPALRPVWDGSESRCHFAEVVRDHGVRQHTDGSSIPLGCYNQDGTDRGDDAAAPE